jgi:tetratricopeptide (TPR) repeat protein
MDSLGRAFEDYARSIKLESGRAMAFYHRGLAYYDHEFYDPAIVDLTRVTRFEPGNAAAWEGLGDCYAAQKKFDLALLDYAQAMKLDSTRADVWAKRGFASWKLGNTEEARRLFSRASEHGKELLSVPADSVENWLGRIRQLSPGGRG